MADSKFVPVGAGQASQESTDEWAKADTEIEANRRRMDESHQERGKSLYETLQANKAAKQEAFEESIRLKNQFRSLDEDEADFLDSVLESTRAQEAAILKETTEQLDIFRKNQEEAEKTAKVTDVEVPNEEENWAAGSKRRRKVREKEQIRGVKLRKRSHDKKGVLSQSQEASENNDDTLAAEEFQPRIHKADESPEREGHVTANGAKRSAAITSKSHQTPLLGLGDYSSDDND